MSATSTWSQFFKRVGWSAFYYQKQDHFIVDGPSPMLVVVGRRFRVAVAAAEAAAAAKNWRADLLVVGTRPLPEVKSWLHEEDDEVTIADPPAGLLGEYVHGWLEPLAPRDGDRPMPEWNRPHWDWDAGLWLRCDQCHRLGIYHEMRGWHARPCGHTSGPWHLGNKNVPAIERAWAISKNHTKKEIKA